MMAMVFDNAGAGGGGGGGADAWSLAATQEPIRKKQLFFTWNLQCTVAFKKKNLEQNYFPLNDSN